MSQSELSGHGLGLRKPHDAAFLAGEARVDFVEVISENVMVDGGKPRDILRRVRANYPVALHGVSMSVGSADGVESTWATNHLVRARPWDACGAEPHPAAGCGERALDVGAPALARGA